MDVQNFDIVRRSDVENTFRVAAIRGTFDLQDANIEERFTGKIELPDDWSIGIIVGNSGTGKTTIARELFGADYITQFEYTAKSVVDDMPKGCTVEAISKAFNAVGFSSVPSWLKPYAVLSNGEKMRVDLARAMLSNNDMFVFDEFTSVVDRNVAKIASFAMQKAIRRGGGNKRFIAVSCHFDIIDWLMPDWIFNTNDMTFRVCGEQKKNRPECTLRLYEVFGVEKKRQYWKMFARYHYLSHSHNFAARVFIGTLNDEICLFTSILPFPHPTVKNTWKEHRTIVLPDYQGIGLSKYTTEYIAEMLKKEGKHYITTTSNPARIATLKKSPKFICTRIGRASTGSNSGKIHNKNKKGSTSSERITASFKYVG